MLNLNNILDYQPQDPSDLETANRILGLPILLLILSLGNQLFVTLEILYHYNNDEVVHYSRILFPLIFLLAHIFFIRSVMKVKKLDGKQR